MTLATAETIHGWTTASELEWLFQTARSLPCGAVWVELGVWKGRSFFTVAMGLRRRSKLIAVDSFTPTVTSLPFVPSQDWVQDHFRAVYSGIKRLREDLRIEVVRLDTSEASRLVPDASVDVVYFDADHSREGLAKDLSAWIPKVKLGGLFCGHDYNEGFPGVIELVDELFPAREIIPETSIWQARKSNMS
ncbi:MAG: class I SAM-dependent methyltransferase [Schlesneria sp.]